MKTTKALLAALTLTAGLGLAAPSAYAQNESQSVRNRIETVLENSGASEAEAREQSAALAQRVQQIRAEYLRELQSELQQGLRQAGLDEGQARQQAQRLAKRIDRSAGETGYAGGEMSRDERSAWVKEEVEEAFEEAGASREEARSAGTSLSRQITDDTSEKDIQRRIAEQMQQADISGDRAERQSQRLAARIHDVMQGDQADVYGFGGAAATRDRDDNAQPRQARQLKEQLQRAGMTEQEAEREAIALHDRFQEVKSGDQVAQLIQRSLERNADLSETQARQQARDIAERLGYGVNE